MGGVLPRGPRRRRAGRGAVGISGKGLIDSLPERLCTLIRRHNRFAIEPARIQLRAAAHIGPVHHDGHSLVGTDVNLLFRMLEGRPLKRALAASGAELAMAVSDYVYHSLVCRYPSLVSPDAFQAMRFQVKHTRTKAWTYLPGQRPAPTVPAQTAPMTSSDSSGTEFRGNISEASLSAPREPDYLDDLHTALGAFTGSAAATPLITEIVGITAAILAGRLPPRQQPVGRHPVRRAGGRRVRDLHRRGRRFHRRPADRAVRPAAPADQLRGNARDGRLRVEGPDAALRGVRAALRGPHPRAVVFRRPARKLGQRARETTSRR